MKLAAKIVLTVVIALCALLFGTSTYFFTAAMVSAYFALTLTGATTIHLRIHPSLRDAALVIAGMLVFAFIDFRVLHFQPAIAGWFSFAGVTSLAIMGFESVWT